VTDFVHRPRELATALGTGPHLGSQATEARKERGGRIDTLVGLYRRVAVSHPNACYTRPRRFITHERSKHRLVNILLDVYLEQSSVRVLPSSASERREHQQRISAVQ
jgi:hypothetical protein